MLLPRSAEEAVGDPAGSAFQSATRRSEYQGSRVLLAEDNEEVAAVVTTMLAELGCRVTHAVRAEAALDAFSEGGTFDLVLSDIVMPGSMNGLDLARELRRRAPDLPVVLMTGYSDASAEAADEFPLFRKPFAMSDLVRMIGPHLVHVRGGAVRPA
jgi:CheY-like chemotaxis protein